MKILYKYTNDEFVYLAQRDGLSDTVTIPDTGIIFFADGESAFDCTDTLSFLRNPDILCVNIADLDKTDTVVAIREYIIRHLNDSFMVSGPAKSTAAATIIEYILKQYPAIFSTENLRRGIVYYTYDNALLDRMLTAR